MSKYIALFMYQIRYIVKHHVLFSAKHSSKSYRKIFRLVITGGGGKIFPKNHSSRYKSTKYNYQLCYKRKPDFVKHNHPRVFTI